jgi:putative sigma-54 modulation protein
MATKLVVTGRKVTVPKELTEYLEKKLPRLEKHMNSSGLKAELIVAKDGPSFLLEIHLKDGSTEIVSKHRDTDPKRGVDGLVDRAERAIARLKERSRKLGLKTGKATKKLNSTTEAVDLPATEEPLATMAKKPKVKKKAAAPRPKSGTPLPVVLEKLGVRVFPPVQSVEIENMSVTEAGERLFFQDENFLVFRQTESGRLSVMFRRKDGHFGIVEPAE